MQNLKELMQLKQRTKKWLSMNQGSGKLTKKLDWHIMFDLSLKDVYRASDVNRWQIVKTMRQQSVADHSYQVAMITIRLCSAFELSEKTTNECIRYALVHDISEVLTGDIASPIKVLIGDAISVINNLESTISFMGEMIKSDCDTVKKIVKIADLIEAIKFLDDNATTQHGRAVKRKLIDRVSIMGGKIADDVVREILMEDDKTLDDMV